MTRLVLTRGVGQTISIDNGRITVEVAEINGQQVRLSVVAPREIDVHRGEVESRIARELMDPMGYLHGR